MGCCLATSHLLQRWVWQITANSGVEIDGIVEKNLALPLADLYLTLARIKVLLQKSRCLLQAKPRSSNERGWETMPDSFSSFPACTPQCVSHTHCIHPPCPGESPCQCSILPEMLSYSSSLTEESKTRWYNEAGICC